MKNKQGIAALALAVAAATPAVAQSSDRKFDGSYVGAGVGLENVIGGALGDWGLRASIGSSRADFGDRPTNASPDNPIEANLGVVRHF
jgi:hypothetical protein